MTRKAPQQRPASNRRGKAPAATKGSEGQASFRWLLPVAALSAFIGFIVYLDSIQPDERAPREPAETVSTAPAQPTTPKTEQQPNFRFYDMLPESTVVPPNVDAYEPGPDATARNIEYILQTGSFRSEADAERQRAQVGFQGLRAEISRVAPQPDNVWYRVQVGPYTNRSEMNRAIDRLVSINIQPLVRQRTIQDGEG